MKIKYIVTAPNVYLAECKAEEMKLKLNEIMILTYDVGGIVARGRLQRYWECIESGEIKLVGMTLKELKRWCK